MVRVITKHFWVIHLLFIAAAAWLVTHLFAVIIQDRLITYPQPSSAKSSPLTQVERQEPYDRYAPITERNIFNPGEKGLKLLPLEEKKTTVSSGREPSGSPGAATGGNYKLVGTITGPGASSYAIIQDGADRKQKIYRIHENIDGGKIISIFRDRVLIKRQGEVEILSFIEKEKEVRPKAAASPAAPAGEVVKRLSASRFLINREDVTAFVGNINQFMTQARFKPHFVMGQPGGFSISEIVPGSLIEKIGLRNNDVLKKVNGQAINKPEEIFQAYSQLLRDANIEVEIERGGRSEVFRYEIK